MEKLQWLAATEVYKCLAIGRIFLKSNAKCQSMSECRVSGVWQLYGKCTIKKEIERKFLSAICQNAAWTDHPFDPLDGTWPACSPGEHVSCAWPQNVACFPAATVNSIAATWQCNKTTASASNATARKQLLKLPWVRPWLCLVLCQPTAHHYTLRKTKWVTENENLQKILHSN